MLSCAASFEGFEEQTCLAREVRIGPQGAGALGREIELVIEHDGGGARGEDNCAVGEEGCFDRGVRHEEDGHFSILPEGAQLLIEVLAGDFIECGERLIEQEEGGIGDEGAGEADAHAHAA